MEYVVITVPEEKVKALCDAVRVKANTGKPYLSSEVASDIMAIKSLDPFKFTFKKILPDVTFTIEGDFTTEMSLTVPGGTTWLELAEQSTEIGGYTIVTNGERMGLTNWYSDYYIDDVSPSDIVEARAYTASWIP